MRPVGGGGRAKAIGKRKTKDDSDDSEAEKRKLDETMTEMQLAMQPPQKQVRTLLLDPSVTPARRSCSPDVVDQFVVVEGKVTGDIAVPLGKRNTTAKVKFIIFPDSYHCRHVADDGRNLINSSTESPGFHGIFTEFLVEPVPVHNMKVGFISPVAV